MDKVAIMNDSKKIVENHYNGKRNEFEYTQINMGKPEDIFPLLSPLREAEWSPGFNYNLIFNSQEEDQLDLIFSTKEHEYDTRYWIVVEHVFPTKVKMINFYKDLEVVILDLKLSDNGNGTTSTKIKYSHTSLTKEGEPLVERFTEDHYIAMMKHWEIAINHYLKTGQLIKMSELYHQID